MHTRPISLDISISLSPGSLPPLSRSSASVFSRLARRVCSSSCLSNESAATNWALITGFGGLYQLYSFADLRSFKRKAVGRTRTGLLWLGSECWLGCWLWLGRDSAGLCSVAAMEVAMEVVMEVAMEVALEVVVEVAMRVGVLGAEMSVEVSVVYLE